MLYAEKRTVEDFILQEIQRMGWVYVSPKEMNALRNGAFQEPPGGGRPEEVSQKNQQRL